MTEEESRKALFELNNEYMSHTPKERLELYEEYREKREQIRHELARAKYEKIQNETKTK